MTQTTKPLTLTQSLDRFTRELDKNPLIVQAYRTDIAQFIRYLEETDCTVTTAGQVERSHITEYVAYLKSNGRSGVTRTRKLISLQVFFSSLVKSGLIPRSPAAGIDRPKKEKRPKDVLRPDEYNRLLVQAGRANKRDCPPSRQRGWGHSSPWEERATMKHSTLPYPLREPPKALTKTRLDNIALVPASLLKEKSQWQAIANRLPTGSVLCIPQTQRQRTILESVARFLRSKGRQVIQYPLERISTAKKKPSCQVENLQLAL